MNNERLDKSRLREKDYKIESERDYGAESDNKWNLEKNRKQKSETCWGAWLERYFYSII